MIRFARLLVLLPLLWVGGVFAGDYSAVDSENFGQHEASGTVTETQVLIASGELYSVSLNSGNFQSFGKTFSYLAPFVASDVSWDGSTAAFIDSASLNKMVIASIEGQELVQKGQSFSVEPPSELTNAISINGDGTVFAFGAASSGYARVYEWDGASWNQKGADISRPDGILFGYQLDLSDSGDRLIVFARDRVTAYDWNGSSWEQTGQQFKLSSAGVADMQVSQDGNTVALGGDDPVDWGGAGEDRAG